MECQIGFAELHHEARERISERGMRSVRPSVVASASYKEIVETLLAP